MSKLHSDSIHTVDHSFLSNSRGCSDVVSLTYNSNVTDITAVYRMFNLLILGLMKMKFLFVVWVMTDFILGTEHV